MNQKEINDVNSKLKESNEFIETQSNACYSLFSEDLKEDENTFKQKIKLQNLSNKNKLIKLYNLSDKIMNNAKNFVACKETCSHCCHINVQITYLEVEHIQKNTGIKANVLNKSKIHNIKDFLGVACPFLKENKCSIYQYRPFACRKHLSFDKDNYWCNTQNFIEKPIKQISFDYEDSYFHITNYNKTIVGDIRDFFGDFNEKQ